MKFLRRIPYPWLLIGPSFAFGLGILINALVLSVNGGQMPVLVPGGCKLDQFDDDIIHTCMTRATHLKFLADWIVLNGADIRIASPGDFILWLGEYAQWPAWAVWVGLMWRDREEASRWTI